MVKPISAFLLLLLCAIGKSSSAEAQSLSNNRSLLWQVSGQNLDKPSYIFGTIHLICPDDYIWTPSMQKAFEKAQEICFEMDMDDPAVMMTIASGLMDNSGKTLEDHFTPQDYKKLTAYVRDSLNMSITMFNTMKPTLLPMLFSGKSSYCKLPVSYEDKLTQAAKDAKKNVSGIERPEEQLELFNKLPADSVIKEIMDIVNGIEQDDTTYNSMIAAYKAQDLPALYELISREKEMDDNMGAFVDERNIKWIPRMIDMMDQRSTFFAVGAGHLWGENGIISLLRKEGYTVKPLR
jgi:uncharacterized protein YbaP (TraB family)